MKRHPYGYMGAVRREEEFLHSLPSWAVEHPALLRFVNLALDRVLNSVRVLLHFP